MTTFTPEENSNTAFSKAVKRSSSRRTSFTEEAYHSRQIRVEAPRKNRALAAGRGGIVSAEKKI
jgi:hypothetical protein